MQVILYWIGQLIYVTVLIVCTVISFVLGYLLARPKSRDAKSPLPISEAAEAELRFLEAQTGKVRNFVNDLLATKNVGLPPQLSRYEPKVVIRKRKPGRVRKLLNRVFGPRPKPRSVPHDALVERLKEIKGEIASIRTDLSLVVSSRSESKGKEIIKPGIDVENRDFDEATFDEAPFKNDGARDAQRDYDDDSWPTRDLDDRATSYAGETNADEPIITRRARPNSRSEVIALYNQAVTDIVARERFREAKQPLRLGTVNAVERRQNPTATIKPEFRESTDGDFFAFPILGTTQFAVVPRLGLTIGPVSYHAGALGEMFGNPDYDPARSYSRYQVKKPAIFKRDGDRWELQSPGKLELGPGD